MKICFPVAVDNGINSELFSHFASAPQFLIIDTESGNIETVENCDVKDPMKGCDPFAALQERNLDRIIVDAIGDAIHQTMNMCGFRVFAATSSNLQQLIEALKNEELDEIEPFYSQEAGRCGDGEEGSCDHDHDSEEETVEIKETPGNCVLKGGNGCADHGSDSCSAH
jgi:predicted Fe-Mo cluster-binding NifX family protein